MFGRLLLLFLIVPVADLALLVGVGGRIGLGPTLAIVVLTAVVGSWLARREGTAAWRRVQAKLATGGVPGPELVDGVVILVSGTLLLTPGFLTDVVGLLGLFPPTRALARRALRARFEQAVTRGSVRVVSGGAAFGPAFGGAPPPPVVEDAEVIDDGSGREP
ncbi:FxsA family protein [Rubrivirga sp.]|uniref:FxsA family protein n=1 Tax=Rubrivirga sp. TaxID=1885344 RepID=UPI003B51E2F8